MYTIQGQLWGSDPGQVAIHETAHQAYKYQVPPLHNARCKRRGGHPPNRHGVPTSGHAHKTIGRGNPDQASVENDGVVTVGKQRCSTRTL